MKKLTLHGTPNEKQQLFFRSRVKYTAYGGSRGGGKSWALRRKLILMCLRYPNLRALLIRRSYPELQENHVLPLKSELSDFCRYSDTEKSFLFPNGSRITLGYLATDGDALRYQGQEYDVIALDEATQLSEFQFQILKACLRGPNGYPKRMYLTCNPGGIGHAWVKRLFIDRVYRTGEDPSEYAFIRASVFDNRALLDRDPEYVKQLESLPRALRAAWLYGEWNLFEGQFFPEVQEETHLVAPFEIPAGWRLIGGLDYGFDMTAFLLLAVDHTGRLYVIKEYGESNLTLSTAAEKIAGLCRGLSVSYIAASPDLWNRRQDTGESGYEIMMRVPGMPPLLRADNRRVPGWRVLREYLRVPPPTADGAGQGDAGEGPRLRLFSDCRELYRCLCALLFDRMREEDAAGEPHDITHFPEALRYAVMSRAEPAEKPEQLYAERMRRYRKRRGIAQY